jgi:hypothetical protein
MQRLLCFLCGFAFMAGLGASLSLGFPLLLMVLLLLIPVVLLVLVLALPGWMDAAQARRSQVHVYVPPAERRYPDEVTRPYVPGHSRR